MWNFLRRIWIPLLIVAVVLVAGFTVMRVRTFFGTGPGYVSTENSAGGDTKPFNPKVVTYEVFGSGTSADVSSSTWMPIRSAPTVSPCPGRSH